MCHIHLTNCELHVALSTTKPYISKINILDRNDGHAVSGIDCNWSSSILRLQMNLPYSITIRTWRAKTDSSKSVLYVQDCHKIWAANKYFFLEGHVSDQVTILIGHHRKLVGHDSPYRLASWHLEQASTSFLVQKNLAFSNKKGWLMHLIWETELAKEFFTF